MSRCQTHGVHQRLVRAAAVPVLILTAAGCEGEASQPAPDAGAEAGADCELNDDPQGGPAVQVAIRNDRSEPIYLVMVTHCAQSPLHLSVTGPNDEGGRWGFGGCYRPPITCGDIMDGRCSCAGACGMGHLIRIEPSRSYPFSWPGRIYVDSELPGACNTACTGGGPRACPVLREAPAGDYVFQAGAVLSTPSCQPGDAGADPCACPPPDDAWCEAMGSGSTPAIEASATIAYPGVTTVDLVFE